MPSNYPSGFDSFENPSASDEMDDARVPHAELHSQANDAIEAIETELGTNPSGSYPTVASRFDALSSLGTSISIAAQGAVTAATNGSTVSIGAPSQTVQTQNLHNVALSGNTAGTMTTISSGVMTIAGGNNITLSQAGNAFTVSGAPSGLTTAAQSDHSHGNPTLALTNLTGTTASASNGLTLSLSGNAAGLTTAAQSNHSHGNPTLNLTNLAGTTASASNGLTLSLSATAGLTTAAQSDHSHGNPTLALTNLTGTTASASNGLTISLSGNPPGGGAGHADVIAGNTAGATASVSSGTLQWAGGNNITLSQNANSITISGANLGGAQTGISGIAGSNTTYTSGTVQFIGTGGGITVSTNTGQRIDLSVAAPVAQTIQTQLIQALVPAGNTSGTTASLQSGSVGIYGGNSITVSQSTGANSTNFVIVGPNALTTAAQSDHSHGNPTLALTNLTGTTASASNGVTLSLSGPNALTTAAQSNHSHGNPTLALTNLAGTTASASNGLTLSLSATAGLTTAAQSDHSHGNPTLALTNLTGTTASASNGLTLSLSGQPAQTVQTQLIQALVPAGNTSGTTASVQSGSIGIYGGNSITVSQSTGAASTNFVIVGPNALTTAAQVSHSHGNPTLALTNLAGTTASASNGLTLSLSATAGLTTAAQSDHSHGNPTLALTNLTGTTASASNGLTLSLSGPNALTTAAQVSHSHGNPTLALTNLTGTTASASNGLTLSLSGNGAQTIQTQLIQALVPVGNTSGTTASLQSNSIGLSAGNNITISQSSGANSTNLVIIGGAGAAAGSGTFGISNLGNTSGTSGTIAGSNHQLVLAGGNNVTLSQSINGSSATVTISAGAGGAGSNTIGMSNIGNTSGSSGAVQGSAMQYVLAGGNNITLSQSTNGSSGTVTISANVSVDPLYISGNTSGTTASILSGALMFAGGNNITLSQDSNSITISGANAGAGGAVSMYPEFPISTQMSGTLYSGSVGAGGNSTATTVSAWVQPMPVDAAFVWNELRIPVQWTATTTVTSKDWSYSQGITAGIYTKNGTQLNLVESYSNRLYVSHRSTNTSGNASITASMSYGGSDTNGSSNVGLSTNAGTAAGFWTRMTNTKNYLFRGGTSTTSMSAGQYYLVVAGSYSTAGSNLNALSQVGHYAAAIIPGAVQDWALATNSSTNAYPLLGLASLVMNSNTVWPITIATNAITQSGSNASLINRMIAASFIARTV